MEGGPLLVRSGCGGSAGPPGVQGGPGTPTSPFTSLVLSFAILNLSSRLRQAKMLWAKILKRAAGVSTGALPPSGVPTCPSSVHTASQAASSRKQSGLQGGWAVPPLVGWPPECGYSL